MPSFSSVIVMGHLVRDPELRYTPEGAAVSNFTVAVNHRFTRKDGEKGEEVAFVDVTAWNRQAETCAEYLKKGKAVLVSGRLAQDNWEDKETGKKRTKLRVVAGSVQFLGGGSKDEESTTEETLPEEAPASAPVPTAPPKPPAKAKR
jgi:single-strand DNA-binding protein